ncbi:hypothetical protein LS68_003235 [Helicobacter sp. MIT 05-5293]|uniref:hypothetical protein n=1 Tax=Helicobacter sp. MIT 05-5293 TaxID=1548149 RepID=UPI00051CFD25|nr:hypothetical protein [Helicobacter sp. MIT 05-5293]TLD82030.1 hypothetical protein LS68_003235 [Helicobacter sp. MIT 05-5293]
MQKALDLFLRQKRFDLIFKYLYVKYPHNNFIKQAYLENIRAFNDFYEDDPSYKCPKESPQDFLNSFDKLILSIKDNNFIATNNQIPIGKNNEISDGAHRLAICAFLDLNIETKEDDSDELYDFIFFRKNNMSKDIMDYGALEYVKLHPHAYIVNLHSITDRDKDEEVYRLLETYGFVFYQKDVQLSFNGYVNLKKISYGSFWNQESWIGDTHNKFAGAQEHARLSMGQNPMRVYIFVCDEFEKVVKAKQEIRNLFGIGNYSVHINDTKEEAIALAQIYFNQNSLDMINYRSFKYESSKIDSLIQRLMSLAKEKTINIDNICGSGSTPLNVYGLRESSDLDFLCCDENNDNFNIQEEDLSNHDSELIYYPYPKDEIINNPKFHFYYKGMKFISLDILYQMKKKRNEKPKDIKDCKLIQHAKKNRRLRGDFKLIQKNKIGNKREIILFGVLKFCYTKNKNKG